MVGSTFQSTVLWHLQVSLTSLRFDPCDRDDSAIDSIAIAICDFDIMDLRICPYGFSKNQFYWLFWTKMGLVPWFLDSRVYRFPMRKLSLSHECACVMLREMPPFSHRERAATAAWNLRSPPFGRVVGWYSLYLLVFVGSPVYYDMYYHMCVCTRAKCTVFYVIAIRRISKEEHMRN